MRARRDQLIKMKELTRADDATCSYYLEMYGWDLEKAVQEYFSRI